MQKMCFKEKIADFSVCLIVPEQIVVQLFVLLLTSDVRSQPFCVQCHHRTSTSHGMIHSRPLSGFRTDVPGESVCFGRWIGSVSPLSLTTSCQSTCVLFKSCVTTNSFQTVSRDGQLDRPIRCLT